DSSADVAVHWFVLDWRITRHVADAHRAGGEEAAALDDESRNTAMKERAVVGAAVGVLEKVRLGQGRIVEQADIDRPGFGPESDDLRIGCAGDGVKVAAGGAVAAASGGGDELAVKIHAGGIGDDDRIEMDAERRV